MAIRYTSKQAVLVRLKGKVRIDATGRDENKMSEELFARLISEAETQVEFDLSSRYSAPFQGADGTSFLQLPVTTSDWLKTMCELMSAIRILETDFGEGTVTDAEKYTKNLQKRYDMMLDRSLAKRKVNGEETGQWLYPPLPNLQLSPNNEVGDDGYVGAVRSTSEHYGGLPLQQINSPGETVFNGRFER